MSTRDFGTIVIAVQALGRYMAIGYLAPQGCNQVAMMIWGHVSVPLLVGNSPDRKIQLP